VVSHGPGTRANGTASTATRAGGDRSALPRRRIFLHIGEPKTGTTFLQQVMATNRAELVRQGIVYPGPKGNAHWRAAQDLREIVQKPNDPEPPFTGEWAALVRKLAGAKRIGVVSHELFSAATRAQAARALAALSEYELHLVLTVRDLGSLLPAEWQETVKHRNARSFDAWLEHVAREASLPDRHRSGFWSVHDTLAIIDDWAQDVIPPERVHVITMPSRTATDSLWDRFARVVGIDTDHVDTSRARSNVSLGIVEVELIRRLNEVLPPEYPGWSFQWFVKDTLAHGTFPKHPMSPRLQLPPSHEEWATKHGEALLTGFRDAGYHVVGDPDDLLPKPGTPGARRPEDATTQELLDAALLGMTGLLERMDRMRNNMTELQRRQKATAQSLVEYVPEYGPIRNRLIALSEKHHSLATFRRGYWRVMHVVRLVRAKLRSR
jgi:hypothetical protein